MSKKFTFKVESFRKIPCPLGHDKQEENPQLTYVAVCNVKNLPESIPMDTNPREQNLKTKVARKIEQSFLQDQNFHLLNRGLVLSAESVKFNNDTNMLTLDFPNQEKHGNLDGGHTYKIILRNRGDLTFDQYVRMEILTGIEDFFQEVVGARNTSVQVKDESLAELEHKFQIIKDALASTPFSDRIAYRENDDFDIDVREIIAILTMFNIKRYNDNSHPIVTYSQKQTCLTHYLADIDEEDNPFLKMKAIAPQIFALYNHIERNMPYIYIKSKEGGGRYGGTKGVTYKDGREFCRLLYAEGEEYSKYDSPKGWIYPIVAAFRSIVEEDSETGTYRWSNNVGPLEYLEDEALFTELVVSTVLRSKSLGSNPNAVGKDSGHWKSLYTTVQNKFLRDKVRGLKA